MANKRVHVTPVKSGIPAKTWASPNVRSPPSFKSPTSSSRDLLEGYVSAVGSVQKSYVGNPNFFVLIKVKSDEFVEVRVMEALIASTIRDQFMSLKGRAAKLSVTKTSDDTVFFNEHKGGNLQEITYELDFPITLPITKLGSVFPPGRIPFILGTIRWTEEERLVRGNYRVRKCLIKDLTGESLLSFWNGHIDEVIEGKWYLVTAVDQTSYYGNELGCSKATIIDERKKPEQQHDAPSTTAAQNRGENVGEEVVEKNKESRQQQKQQPSQTEQQHDTPSTTAARNREENVGEEVVEKNKESRQQQPSQTEQHDTPSTTTAAQNRGENVGEEVVEKNKESRQQQQQEPPHHDTPPTTAEEKRKIGRPRKKNR